MKNSIFFKFFIAFTLFISLTVKSQDSKERTLEVLAKEMKEIEKKEAVTYKEYKKAQKNAKETRATLLVNNPELKKRMDLIAKLYSEIDKLLAEEEAYTEAKKNEKELKKAYFDLVAERRKLSQEQMAVLKSNHAKKAQKRIEEMKKEIEELNKKK